MRPSPTTSIPLALAMAAALAAALDACSRRSGETSGGASQEPTMQRTHPDTSDKIAINQLKAGQTAGPQVTSPAFANGGTIPDLNSAYDRNVSPQLTWTTTPGVKSWALIVEDPDAPKADPFVHWVAWDIPGDATSLPEGLAASAKLDRPAGMHQGKNGSGSVGWFGPRPPRGDPEHHYHFQIFALDTPSLGLSGAVDRKALVKAMEGHVMADGELIGVYQAKPAH
jgi:Raf kinase inhibitor-like YbhB/YbcL family protein